MGEIRAALYYHLSHTAAITALVDTRVYPAGNVSRGTASPYLTYFRVAGNSEYEQRGASGLRNTLWQIDAWADTPLEANALGDAVKDALDAYRGSMGADSNAVSIQCVELVNESDLYEAPSDASERALHRVSLDWRMWYLDS